MLQNVKQNPSNIYKSILDKDYLIASILGLFAFLIYANTLAHGFVFDDDLVCRLNPHVQQGVSAISEIFSTSWYEAFSGEKDRYYRPMMVASFALEKELFGFNPLVFHLNNILLYGINIFLLFILLRKLIPTLNKSIVIITVFLFAAHPIHTEVVANIKGRDEILSFLGLMIMLLASTYYSKSKSKTSLIVSLFAFFFALLSKESSIAFIGLIPISLYFFTNTKYSEIFKRTLPYAILATFYLWLRSQIVDTSPPSFDIIDNSLLAASSFAERLATTIYMLGLYLKLLLFPYPLSHDYSFNHIPLQGFSNLKVLISAVLVAIVLSYGLLKLKAKDLLSFSILWMIITFIITSNIFFLIGTTFAERLMFTPSLGFCLGISILLHRFLISSIKLNDHFYFTIAMLLILSLSLLTLDRNKDWKSNETLFSKDIENAPNNSRIQSHYAKILFDKSQQLNDQQASQDLLKSSIDYYERSIEIYAKNPQTYQNLGLAHTKLGELNKAVNVYTLGIEVNNEYSPLYINRAEAYYNSGNYEMAIKDLIKAEQLTPQHSSMILIFGLAYTKLKDYKKALPYLLQTHENQPLDRNTLICLVEVYRSMNQIDTAIFYDKKLWALNNN